MPSSSSLPPSPWRRCLLLVVAGAVVILLSDCLFADAQSCPFSSPAVDRDVLDHHHCDHHRHRHHEHRDGEMGRQRKLPEELAEDEDLEVEGFGHHHHHHHHHPHDEEMDVELSPLRIWVQAMGCSLLVSMASLVCLIMLPVFFLQGKPSKTLVDALAVFGAGAMLGDAFLHQLPHAFGGGHSHSHDHDISEFHDHHDGHGQSHSHSLESLSVGLSVLSGIVLFLLVEKVVRYVEDVSGKGHQHHHHHVHHKGQEKADEGSDDYDKRSSVDSETKGSGELGIGSEKKPAYGDVVNDEKHGVHETHLRKRATSTAGADDEGKILNAGDGPVMEKLPVKENVPSPLASSLVFGYLNLFSDGVHNFTDGMALGSAFLLHGSVGGWSRTLFLLAHELPQEVGDFGILVRSGFTVSKALFFNFLSALVALAGTAMALILGKDPGQSSLIEGFTAGGFIYIAVAGVLPEMNSGNTTFKSTFIQLTSLVLGMAVALCISLVE